jgi:hypothetical protein
MNPLVTYHQSLLTVRYCCLAVMLSMLACLGLAQLAPKAFGVSPAPDGGYPNFTTAEGLNALKNLTSGAGNTAVGWYSLFAAAGGSYNTGVGAGTLVLNTGNENTAIGGAALLLNHSAVSNTATGFGALVNNDSTGNGVANWNSAFGANALYSNTDGVQNSAFGESALYSNTIGNYNTAIGDNALRLNQSASANTAVGYFALNHNSDGANNTAVGAGALVNNDHGGGNTAMGTNALANNVHGANNAAVGGHALFNNDHGGNTAVGVDALYSNNQDANTAIGLSALSNNTTGAFNTAVGQNAGSAATTGDNNVYIGAGVTGVAGESDACYIASIFGQSAPSGASVSITSGNKLGTITSSKRFKDEIKPMDESSEALFALKPVTFRYKKNIDPAGIAQFGLVAEDVEKVNPDLVVRDRDGKPYSVRYDQVNAMLLNEFLKAHRKMEDQDRKMQEQETTIAQLKKEMETVIAHAREQDSKIQGVSAQIEVNKFARRTAGRIRRGGAAPKVAGNDRQPAESNTISQ